MVRTWGNEINYAPDYWTTWFVLAMVIIAAAFAGVVAHGLLRVILTPKKHAAEEEKLYLYPTMLRIWHWTNAALFIFLLTTGIVNHFSSSASLVKIHKYSGFALIFAWVFFIAYNAVSGNGRFYIIQFKGFIGRSINQVRFYVYGILKGEPHPYAATKDSKFNPLQQMSYVGVIYGLIPLIIVTGLLTLFPVVTGKGQIMLIAHGFLGLMGLVFMIIHVYLCTGGDYFTQFFKSMMDGYHRHYKHD